MSTPEPPPGRVYLVGAGPGDPGLLTARALELIARADTILYDRLIPPQALEGARTDAELLFVGKEGGGESVPQEQTEALLVERARAGRMVVRLKGGDPFVFGRGGEEALALRAARIPFEIVPGITAGVAAPAYAGIPVTHRGLSTAVALITGHTRGDRAGAKTGIETETAGYTEAGDTGGHREPPENPEEETALDWDALAAFPGTLVFYMGVRQLAHIAASLIEAGRPASEPAAVVEQGTLPTQRTVTGTLATIAERAQVEGVRPPSITVIGPVAGLAEQLAWREGGIPEREGGIPEREGGIPEREGRIPEREGRIPEREGRIPEREGRIPEREGRIPEREGRIPEREGRIPEREGRIPEREGRIPEREGRIPEREGGIPEREGGIPEREGGIPEREGRIPEREGGIPEREGRIRYPLSGRAVAVTRARAQASGLARQLQALGATVVQAPVIRIQPITEGGSGQSAPLDLSPYDLICLTSPNGVAYLFERLAQSGRPPTDARALAGAQVAAIGPGTAHALAEHGITADIVPERSVAESLVEALGELPIRHALIARAREARDVLPDALRARGAVVDVLALYETIAEPLSAPALAAACAADYVTFTSSSTVRFFLHAAGGSAELSPKTRIVSIGPVTSATLREHGLEPHVEARRHDIEGLIDALLADASQAH